VTYYRNYSLSPNIRYSIEKTLKLNVTFQLDTADEIDKILLVYGLRWSGHGWSYFITDEKKFAEFILKYG